MNFHKYLLTYFWDMKHSDQAKILQASCFGDCFFLNSFAQGSQTSYHACLVFWHAHSSAFINLTLERVDHCLRSTVTRDQSKTASVPCRPCRGKGGCFTFNSERESPPSPRLVFLWRWSTAEGETQLRNHRRESSGQIWSTICRGRCAASFSRPEWNMRPRCLKEFDLQLKRLPFFLHYFTQRCFCPRGKSRELVSSFKKRVDVFLGCLNVCHEGMMSINTTLSEVLHHGLGISNSMFSDVLARPKRCNGLESGQD